MDDFWFGLGFLCSDMKFNVNVQKSATSVVGFRVNRSISFRSYIKQQQHKSENRFSFVNKVLESFDLPYDKKITKRSEVEKWMTMINHLKLESRLSDRVGYLRLKWVIENPPPYSPSTFEDFVDWIKALEVQSDIKEQRGLIDE